MFTQCVNMFPSIDVAWQSIIGENVPPGTPYWFKPTSQLVLADLVDLPNPMPPNYPNV